jgi:hypothetical protein
MTSRNNKRFERSLSEVLSAKGANMSTYSEPREILVSVSDYSGVLDREEVATITAGTEKQFIASAGLVKCRKSESTHFVLFCDDMKPNGEVIGLMSTMWAKMST